MLALSKRENALAILSEYAAPAVRPVMRPGAETGEHPGGIARGRHNGSVRGPGGVECRTQLR